MARESRIRAHRYSVGMEVAENDTGRNSDFRPAHREAPQSLSYAGTHSLGKAPALAAERQQILCLTLLATHPQKAMLEPPALQVLIELALHMPRQRTSDHPKTASIAFLAERRSVDRQRRCR